MIGYVLIGLSIILYGVLRRIEKWYLFNHCNIDEIVNWFVKRYPTRKKRPRVIINKGSKSDDGNCSDYDGFFSFHNNSVTLNNKNIKSYSHLVEVIFHEMTHWYLITSVSKNELYQKQLEEYGYENHPQEIWCRSVAETLTKIYLREHS